MDTVPVLVWGQALKLTICSTQGQCACGSLFWAVRSDDAPISFMWYFRPLSFQNLLTDDMLIWYITPQLAVVNIVTSSNKVLTLSVWLQNLPHKSRFPHKLVIFVRDCEHRRELHHSHKFTRILISCVSGKWGVMGCRWIRGRTAYYEIYVCRRWQKY